LCVLSPQVRSREGTVGCGEQVVALPAHNRPNMLGMGAAMDVKPLLIVLAGVAGLTILTVLFWPETNCRVVAYLQLGSNGPRC
jgi:hypothetical protein